MFPSPPKLLFYLYNFWGYLRANTYVYCIDGYCQPYTPQEYATYNDQLVQGTSDAVSIGAKAADRRRAVHDKLMKQVVEDMVGRFTL